jgi:hypothetical protein
MRLSSMVTAVVGFVLVCIAVEAAGPPPVLEHLGRVNPTPVPTEKSYDRKRLITSLTVQNGPDGETIVTFEATDVARMPDGKFRDLASRRYSLTEVKQKHAALRDDALHDLRELESALLRFVDAVGGPREVEKGKDTTRPD